ncbi:MAG: SDR family NAD(P)-dependent oxidoreductase [Moraxellaceae bacterium]
MVGASSGIGLALAEHLLAAGALLAVSARKTAALDVLASRHPGRVEVLALDVTSAGDWEAAHAALQRRWEAVDHFIFCAADYQPVRAWELDAARAARMVDTNLTGALRGVACVLPAMLARGAGHVALVASVAGYMGLPKSLVYGPTKAALINFAEALYLDVHPRGVGVSVINPGFVDTPLTKQNDFAMPALLTPAEAARAIADGIMAGEFEIHFPRRFTTWLRLLRRLPYRLKFRLLAEVAKKS